MMIVRVRWCRTLYIMSDRISGLKSRAPRSERRRAVSIECAIVYIAVSVSGAYAAYQLGRAQVLGEWKLWLEEVYKKLGDD